MRYFVHLAYNGANYYGWQRQPQNISVQEKMEYTFSMLLKEDISVIGAGRTDTGVHARNFYAHFDSDKTFTPDQCAELTFRINAFLPADIAVYEIFAVKPEAHARFDALSRTYRYYVSTCKNPFNTATAFHFYKSLNVEAMNACCRRLPEYEDFTSFSKLHTQTKTNLCNIHHALWIPQGGGVLMFEITANRFLRNMVRAIVGTLLEVGTGRITQEEFCTIIEKKDRCEAGVSVPAHALFLENIEYNFPQLIG